MGSWSQSQFNKVKVRNSSPKYDFSSADYFQFQQFFSEAWFLIGKLSDKFELVKGNYTIP